MDVADRDLILAHIKNLNAKTQVTGTERFREPLWRLLQGVALSSSVCGLKMLVYEALSF